MRPGGIEALLCGPYRPTTIVAAVLGCGGVVAVFYWAGMTVLGAAVLVVLD